MKLSLSILSIIVCVFIVDAGCGRCRKRRVVYVQQSLPVLPPPPPPPSPAFSYQSFDDDFTGREATAGFGNKGNSLGNPQHSNLSCLLFADDGCNVSCGLMCDINGCQSDGYCSQKLHCLCNEVYMVQNRPVTPDQFKKLTFDDLWNYKFKPSNNNVPTPKTRIFNSDELYGYVMPMLQNPHISGREIKEALMTKYPKLKSAQNLEPREHGVKARLFGGGAGAEENLHRYIQKMMNTMQKSVYDRLSHTRYMRRIINLIKNIDDKNELSYILGQLRDSGNQRIFERVRRYLMKKRIFFDDDLKPISRKAGFCVKKKVKCKCLKKAKPKKFSYNYGTTNFANDADSDWIEEEEDEIEMALINELIGTNNVEGKYPINTGTDEQPIPEPEVDYTTTLADDEVPSGIQDTTIIQPQPEIIVEVIPETPTRFQENSMVPPNDIQYVNTPNDPKYSSVTSQQPTMFLTPSNYPEYGTFINGDDNNYIFNKPNPNFPSNQFINYENQQIPDSFVSPQTIYFEEVAQPSKGAVQNPTIPSQSITTSQYINEPSPQTPTMSLNQSTFPGTKTIYQNPDHQIISSSQNLDNQTPTITPSHLQIPPQSTTTTSIITPQNLDQPSQPIIVQPQIIETPPASPMTSLTNEELPQPLDKPLKSQIPHDLPDPTPATTASLQKLVESPQPILTPPSLPKPQPIPSPPQNLLQQFATEKPTPKIVDSSPYLDTSPKVEDLKTFDIPDAVPSIESLFVKHNQSPEKSGTIDVPVSYAEYLLGMEYPTPAPKNQVQSYSIPQLSNVNPSPQSISEPQPQLLTESSHNTFPGQSNLPRPQTPESYTHYSNSNNNIDLLPILPSSSTTFSEIPTQSSKLPSPPTMQKPKEKIYYQVLMDENGNIIKSANYKYPGQSQYIQDTPQMPPAPVIQYTSTTNQAEQPLFDKFDKNMILNAAKSKPGDSMVIDYDMETADNIPVFDIPSDIDMASGTFQVSPDAFGNNYISDHDITNYGPNYNSYEDLQSQMNNGQGSGIILPSGDVRYSYEIDRDNVNNNPSNYGMIGPSKELPIVDSPYPYEINRDNYQIQSNDGLTLDYEDGRGSGNNQWSTYSINDEDMPANYLNEIQDDDTSTIYNSPGPLKNSKQEIYHNINPNNGEVNIEILDGSDDADAVALGHNLSHSNIKSNSYLGGNGNQHFINNFNNGDISALYNKLGALSNGNQKKYNGMSLNNEPEDINEGAQGYKSSFSDIKSKSFSSGNGNQIFPSMNSNENGIDIEIMDGSDNADGIAHKFKLGSSSSSFVKTNSKKSTTTTNNNTIPTKMTNNIDHKTSKNDENTSAASCEFPEDPEDDLLNF